jgi:Zn-dependent M28 family amino/carboxypeptidase
MKNKTTFLAVAACLFACCISIPAQGTLRISTKDEIAADIKLAPCKNGERLEAVRKLFVSMGAADADISTDKVKGMQNLVVTKKGKADETIVVGAHYDKVADGCGAIDNWTGIVILAHLYRSIESSETTKTFVFVAFDSEELGLSGSAAFVKNIPKEKRIGYCSMVNFDSFGFGYPNILTSSSNEKMTKAALDLAADLKMPMNVWSFTGADADSSSFLNNNIPAVTFDGLDGNWPKILHTSKDKADLINAGSVFVGYNFGLRFLAKLDAADCSAFRKK